MFWNKNEDKRRLPDLPIIQNPITWKKADMEHEKHALPSFPDSANEKGFSQTAIKEAVKNEEFGRGRVLPSFPENNHSINEHRPTKSVEMEEWRPSLPKVIDEEDEIEEDFIEPPKMHTIHREEENRKNTDIFVKLSKFYSARKALLDAQDKLQDVDELLKKIRETKMREEQEIISWEKELNQVKSRLNDVTLNLFEKVD